MTREEAIAELREDKALYESDICHAGDGTPDGRLLQALDMAIEALQAEPTHGRLIDADALIEEMRKNADETDDITEKALAASVVMAVLDAPTIDEDTLLAYLLTGKEGKVKFPVKSDTISRADAIDAVRKIVPVETDIDSTLLDKAEVIVELSALPSAEAPTIDAKGVLVKGMEMPKNCVVCKFGDAPEFERFCIVQGYKHLGEWDKTTDRPSDCPLVEITSQAQKEISAEAVQTDCTDFVNWLLEEVMDDENWELNAVALGEIVCRKLKKLGLLDVKDGYYVRTESADDVKVAYICDGRKCDNDCSECFRTLDIEHARDFKLMGDTYYQQPSDKAVPRDYYERVVGQLSHEVTELKVKLESATSAEAVQGWIPCSERLPLVGGEFLVTLVDHDGAWVSTAQWNMTFGGRWQDIFPNDGYRDISNVIAWKTLPTPYTKGDNDEER